MGGWVGWPAADNGTSHRSSLESQPVLVSSSSSSSSPPLPPLLIPLRSIPFCPFRYTISNGASRFAFSAHVLRLVLSCPVLLLCDRLQLHEGEEGGDFFDSIDI